MLTRSHENINPEHEVDDGATMIELQNAWFRSNFVVTNLMDAYEQHILRLSDTDSMLGMIRSTPCQSQFLQYLRLMQPGWTSVDDAIRGIGAPGDKEQFHLPPPCAHVVDGGGRQLMHLEQFAKELTPSDVGKLNRLVIPKKHATECFPHVDSTSAADETVLEFVDRDGRRWRFRYCFWKSSQSYVFTRGWNNFVREKRLRAGDVVVFYRCKEMTEGSPQTYWSIDTVRRRSNGGGAVQSGECNCPVAEMEQEMEDEEQEDELLHQSSELMEGDKKEKGFQLFGVWMAPGEEIIL